MTSETDIPADQTDRRLWTRMRLSMIATLLLGAAVFGTAYLAGQIIVDTYDRKADVISGLERARVLGQQLAVEALLMQQAVSPGHRLVARGALEALHERFRDAYGAALDPGLEWRDPVLRRIQEERPHRMRATVAEVARLVAVIDAHAGNPETSRTGPQASDARRAAQDLRRLSRGQLSRGFDALIAHHKGDARATIRRMEASGLGLVALAIGVFILQWRLSFRPMLRAAEARSRALESAQAQIEQTMLFDGLTGLPNRRNLTQQLERLGPRAPLGLLHIDLIRFGEVNSTFGWETGDRLLRYVAETLGSIALTSDIAARVDADEFVLASTRRTDPEQLQDLAVEIIEQIGQPVEIDGQSFTLEVAIGIAARSALNEVPERLMANAAIARGRAREERGSVYFSSGMRQRLAARRQTAQELMQALVRDEIVPYFQPQIAAASGRLTGFEALVRWRHPERGLLNPHFFLDIAENAHVGHRITAIMLKKSLAALADWRHQGFDVPRVGLNLTARELRQPGLRDLLLFDLERTGLGPADLGLEVLESALIEGEEDPILANVAALSQAGFHIDLDDFGTGHASLSNLRHLAVDRLKIDRSFVRDAHLRPELRKMTQAMIHLAKSLGIAALAEGIETENEWRLLVEMGCDDLQGFAIGKPMPAQAVAFWLSDFDQRRSAGRIVAA